MLELLGANSIQAQRLRFRVTCANLPLRLTPPDKTLLPIGEVCQVSVASRKF